MQEMIRQQMRWYPVGIGSISACVGLACWAIVGEEWAGWLLPAWFAGGAALGMVAVYRSRWAVRHARVSFTLWGVTLCVWTLGILAFVHGKLFEPFELWLGNALLVTALLASLALGVLREYVRLARANQRGRLAAALADYVDLPRRTMFVPFGGVVADWATAVGLALVALTFVLRIWADDMAPWLWWMVAALMFLSAYTLGRHIGPGLVRCAWLDRLTREDGEGFVSEQTAVIMALRRNLWGVDLFCRPGDMAPEPVQAQKRVPPRRKRKRR